MPAILVRAVFNTVFTNPDIYTVFILVHAVFNTLTRILFSLPAKSFAHNAQ